MPQKPQRPFVPHRTPTTAQPTVEAVEFRLYRPFLPGSQRDAVEVAATVKVSEAVAAQPSSSATLRPIGDFLATSPSRPAGVHANERSEAIYEVESDEELFELPPVEHFLDPLPVVEQFAPDSEGALSDAWPASSELGGSVRTQTADPSQSGWAETDWQNFDWRAAAALGEGPDAEASSAWASTDWDGAAPGARDPRPTAAQAIASALDQIAQQIREGELAVPGSAAGADPAKIAATLAALLGVKQ